MLDVCISGGTVVDGTGSPPRRADVGIRAGRIVAAGEITEAAERTIDATGLVVTPGFVDIHTHYDAQILWDPACTPSPLHGVTTVVGGNCGFTIAPMAPSETGYITRMLARVEGMPLEALTSAVTYEWSSFGEYLDVVEAHGVAVNAGFLVGHCALRRVVMGADGTRRAATADEIAAMQSLLAESLAGGGLGFSSSLATTHNDADGEPVPSRQATHEELLALCATTGEHPGTTLEFIPVVGGFAEEHLDLMARMSATADRPLNWNVLAPSSHRAEDNWRQLEAGTYAAERGGRVLALTVPHVITSHLSFKAGFVLDALPGWRKPMALPVPEKMALLSDPEQRRALAEQAASPEAGVLRGMADWGSHTIVETFHPDHATYAGRTVADVAAERGQDPFDALCEISVGDELRTVFRPRGVSDDDASWALRRDVWRDGRAVIGASDAGAHLDMLSTFNYSTSLLQAARDRDLVPLEEAVHYLTDVPARLYGLVDRGRVVEGWHADLVVLDPATVAPAEVSWANDLPAGAGRLTGGAVGIAHVLVNGVEIVAGSELTGATPGTVLRSGRDTETVTAR